MISLLVQASFWLLCSVAWTLLAWSNTLSVCFAEYTYTANGRLACKLCDKTFKWNFHLLAHLREVHRPVEPFRCPLCPFTTKRSRNMPRHMETKHGETAAGPAYSAGGGRGRGRGQGGQRRGPRESDTTDATAGLFLATTFVEMMQ